MITPHPHFAPLALVVAFVGAAVVFVGVRFLLGTYRTRGRDASATEWAVGAAVAVAGLVAAVLGLNWFFSALFAGITKNGLLIAAALAFLLLAGETQRQH
jgi:hypothetical protein